MQPSRFNNYFQFTKREVTGVLAVIFSVLFIFIFAKYIYPLTIKEEVVSNEEIVKAANQLKVLEADTSKNYYSKYEDDDYPTKYKNYAANSFSGSMFYFDPNTLNAEGWAKLGVKEKTIGTILNYVSKGGKFREPDDLRKIWGLRDDEKDRLVPYVRIAESSSSGNKEYSNNYQPYEKKTYEKPAIQAVDVNIGDSTSFDGLPGIGSGFSRRIINFRNKLGGFYKVEQIGETFGLPDSVYQKIKPFLKISAQGIKKININTATNEELKIHPYIRWQLAKVIVEYRTQHGAYKSLDDLKKIMIINEETYNKIAPYLTL